MTAVIHILNNDNLLDNSENLLYNKSFYQINYHQFIITNTKNPHKSLFEGFEQIFYTKKISSLYLKNVLKLLQNLNYKNYVILSSKFKVNKMELNNLDESIRLLDKFSVVDYFF